MAVNDQSGDNNTQQSQPQTQQQPQQDYAAQGGYGQSQQPQQRAGLGNLNSIMGRSGSYDRSESRSAEAMRGLREIAKEALESQGLIDDFEILRFDRDDNRVGLSGILITKSVRVGGATYIAVRTLMLDSDSRLRPRVINLGAQRIDAPTRPQDVFNDVYWNRLTEFLKRHRGTAEATVVDAGAIVIPTDFDFKDEVATGRLLVTSVNRCGDIVARISNETPFTVSNVKRPDERLTARIDFSGQPNLDIVGSPIRADIQITMNRSLASQVQEDDYYDQEETLNSVSGFVNLEYAPTAPQQPQQMQGWGQAPAPTQLFTPTFVITDVAQADWIQARTPELYMLALSNAYRVTAGTQWVKTFLPQVGTKGIDPRDIGALGYMTQGQKKIETKSDSFTEENFVELMTALVRPTPTFLIDVNPVGDNAAIENYFVDAAFEGSNKQRAKQRLVQACDNLTGGAFSRHFGPANAEIVVPYQQEIHLGYYLEGDEKQDIRNLDVLAMLNLTQGNQQDFFDWYRTYVDTSIPSVLNLQRREQMERQYLSKSLRITGRAIRLLFTPQFIESLNAATQEAGVQVDFENVTSVMGGQRFAGNSLVNQYAVSRNATMSYGGGVGQGQGGFTYNGVTSSGRMY